MTSDTLPWERLERPEEGFSILRIDPSHPHNFFWGKESSGKYLLLLEIEDAYEDFIKTIEISLKGIKTDLRLQASGKKFYILALQSNQNADIFCRLCEDLVESTKTIGSKLEALKKLVSRLKRWQQFLSKEGKRILSRPEIQGLFSELKFLEECIEKKSVEKDVLLDSWKGPLGGAQDFMFEDFALEIKSVSGEHNNTVRISSEQQLKTDLDNLYLQVFFLAEYHTCEKGISLNEMVQIIKHKLESHDLIDSFERKLDHASYIEIKEYNTPCYEIIKTRKFEVGENFPRLVPGLLPEGISNVTYNINLHAINDFIFESSYWGDS